MGCKNTYALFLPPSKTNYPIFVSNALSKVSLQNKNSTNIPLLATNIF